MNKIYEYNGLDIKNKVSNEAFAIIFALGNHQYNNYEELKIIIANLIKVSNNCEIELMLNSINDLKLYSIEKMNFLASQGYNKRVCDYCSIICALKDNGFDLSNLKSNNNESLCFNQLNQIRASLIHKNKLGLDIMIDNPTEFTYQDSDLEDASYHRKLLSDSKINGLDLCTLMNYLIHPANNTTIVSYGTYKEKNQKIKVK